MTTYIVLRKSGDGLKGPWVIIGHAEAHGPDQARRKVHDGQGEFLVVPMRNASFIETAVEQQEPKVTSELISPLSYLDIQPELSVEPEPDPAPVAA